MQNEFEIIAGENTPKNILEWNNLAIECGNVLQHTINDEIVSRYYNNLIYFQLYSGSKLVAGVRLYYYQNNKIPIIGTSLSKRMLQHGEILYSQNIVKHDCFNVLNKFIYNYCIEHKIVEIQIKPNYGGEFGLLDFEYKKDKFSSNVGIAFLNLYPSENELFEGIHPKHKSAIKKAIKSDVQFEIKDDIKLFIELLKNTYSSQEKAPPSFDYVINNYEILKKNDFAQLFFAKCQNQYFSGAFIFKIGKVAYYAFGGNIKNSLGTGNFLQWEIIKYLKNKGFLEYNLGQVSIGDSESNSKFSNGITPFKIRFGTTQRKTCSTTIVFSPFKNKLWSILLTINKLL